MNRYSRQIKVNGFGEEGQRKVGDTTVLVIGAGGLGNVILPLLVGAGMGRIGIIDDDVVDLSNLHRQTYFTEDDLGKKKAQVLKKRLERLNSDVKIESYLTRIDTSNSAELISKYDIIVDGSDNFETRYLVNDTCWLVKKPLVVGAVSRVEGQVGIFCMEDANGVRANYRDAYPEPPAEGEILNCELAGVLAPLVTTIGSWQAAEVLKLITGVGRPLYNQLVYYSLATMDTYRVKVKPTAKSDSLLPRSLDELRLKSYGFSCQVLVQEIDVATFYELENKGVLIIDVRELHETPKVSFKNYQQIPLSVIKTTNMVAEDPIIFICQSGKRSLQAANWYMEQLSNGKKVMSLKGGVIKLELG